MTNKHEVMHTPTPWKRGRGIIEGADGKLVAALYQLYRDGDKLADDNGDYIVQAANAYPALIKQVRAICDNMCPCRHDKKNSCAGCNAYPLLKEAGEEPR